MNETNAIIKPALKEIFLAGWERCRVILFSAPCGCGKTTAAQALLAGHNVCTLGAEDALSSLQKPPKGCDAVLVDDLQYFSGQECRQALCDLIRARHDLHFVLLTRGYIPGWLMPFQFTGTLLVIDAPMLLFDRETARQMLEARGHSVSAGEMADIQRDIKGYPIGMDILCRKLGRDTPYGETVLSAVKWELFFYYDEAVYRQFEMPLRRLLVSLAPFEGVHLELAKIVSGDSNVGELLGKLQRDTSMLLFDRLETWHFWPIFREFLMWKLHQVMDETEQRALYSRAALYYELHGETSQALDYYTRAGEKHKVSELLEKNAERHPGLGHYHEMMRYYFALPKEGILRSPTLMCGMSMMTSLCLDYEASEEWYQALQSYAAGLVKNDPEYKSVRSKLAYLDIALPQRGSKGLVEIIKNIFRVMSDKQIALPAFSVTSMLPSIMNGGKDFCEWSKKDDLLYATMRKPLETVLGPDGVGLADCGICESKFEKGLDVSKRLLTLMSRLGEIQAKGTPDIEFAVVGLLARVQVSQGKARAALESIANLRAKSLATRQKRFLPNIDAMLCRLHLWLGDTAAAEKWLHKKAPRDNVRLWTMWRYQYFTRVMVQLTTGEYDDALLVLARLRPYCKHCGRVMDAIYIRLLTALCHFRMGDGAWKTEFCEVLDTCRGYSFIWPVAQYGAAILPLLNDCSWVCDMEYLHRLTAVVRAQAVLYPRFLKPLPAPSKPLSAAETQVLRLLCENLSNQEIGEILDIKLATVKTHVSHILQKLGVSRRSEAKDAAEKLHLI